MLEYFAVNYPVEYMDSVEALVQACNAGFRVDEVAGEHAGPHRRCAVEPTAASSSTTTCVSLVVLAGLDHQPRPAGAPYRATRDEQQA